MRHALRSSAMDTHSTDVQAALLAHAERQTAALESLNKYFMRFIAVTTVLFLVLVVLWLSR